MTLMTAMGRFLPIIGMLALGSSARAQTLADSLKVGKAVGAELRSHLDSTITVALLPLCTSRTVCTTGPQNKRWGSVRIDFFTRAVAENARATISEAGDTVSSCSGNPSTCRLHGMKHYVQVAALVFTSATLATVKVAITSMSGLWRVALFDRDVTMTVDCTGGPCHVTKQHIDRLT